MKRRTKRVYTKRASRWFKNSEPTQPKHTTQLRFTVKDVRISQAPNGKITLYVTTS